VPSGYCSQLSGDQATPYTRIHTHTYECVYRPCSTRRHATKCTEGKKTERKRTEDSKTENQITKDRRQKTADRRQETKDIKAHRLGALDRVELEGVAGQFAVIRQREVVELPCSATWHSSSKQQRDSLLVSKTAETEPGLVKEPAQKINLRNCP